MKQATSRSKRLIQIGWLVTRHAGSMTAIGAMLIGDAIEGQTSDEARDNARIAYDTLGSIIQGLQQVRLGLMPIAGVDISKPDVGPH